MKFRPPFFRPLATRAAIEAAPNPSPNDVAERVAQAQRDFIALLDRYEVQWGVEQGQSSVIGPFLRIVFLDRPPTPPIPPGAVAGKDAV